MKKIIPILLLCLISSLFAEKIMILKKKDGIAVEFSETVVDSITYSQGSPKKVKIHTTDSLYQYILSEVDTVRFEETNPVLSVSPGSLDFGEETTEKSFTIQNIGGEILTSTITADQTWIAVNPASASTTTETDEITVTVDRDELSEGTHTGSITVNSNVGTKEVDVFVFLPYNHNFGTFTDPRDGYIYKTIQIGDQMWLAENLRATTYRNGDPIPNVTDKDAWSDLETTESGAYCVYDNSESNAETYGYLYNWYAVNDIRGLAPEGWHVPTDEEWKQLEMALGMSQSVADNSGLRGTDEGSKLKFTSGWVLNGNGTNESGFSALPGGLRSDSGGFYELTSRAYFWSASERSSNGVWFRRLFFDIGIVYRNGCLEKQGLSVRLVRDN